jgi:diguanylate cyclase (GGDEF)-like protein
MLDSSMSATTQSVRRFDAWQGRFIVERCRLALGIGLAGTVVLGVIDAVMRRDALAALFPVRFATAATVGALLVWRRMPSARRNAHALLLCVYLAAAISVTHVPLALGRLPSGYTFGGLIVLYLAMGVLVPVGWTTHLVAQLAILGYYVARNHALLAQRVEPDVLAVDAAYLLSIVAVIAISVAKFESLRRSEIDARRELHELATIDSLTGVYSRRHLLALGRREIERARRHRRPLCAIMIDVDRFKDVNDVHGHLVGDAVLKEAARRMVAELRSVDVLGRYGGEEFVAFLPELDEATATTVVAERLRARFAGEAFVARKRELVISVSIGVAELGPDTSDVDALLRVADAALYAAKQRGRNAVVAASTVEAPPVTVPPPSGSVTDPLSWQ